jgi:soluble lytic murein transglycosylase-like protein
MNIKFRDAVLIGSYALWLTVCFLGYLFGNPPKPAVREFVAPTEAQIKDQVKHEREATRRTKAINRAVAAARAVYRANGCGDRYSALTGRTAYEYGLSARLLAAVVFVESSCRAEARSGRDSIGLMQVNPRVWGHRAELKDPVSNMRIGCAILKAYIGRFGLVEGLHHYNGIGNSNNDYAERVLAAGGITQ